MKEIKILCGGVCRSVFAEAVGQGSADHPMTPAEWMIRLSPLGTAAAAAGWRAMLCAFRDMLQEPWAVKQLITQPAEIGFPRAEALTEAALAEEELARILMGAWPEAKRPALLLLRCCLCHDWIGQVYYFLSLTKEEERGTLIEEAIRFAQQHPVPWGQETGNTARPPASRIAPEVVQQMIDLEKQRICKSPPRRAGALFLDLVLLWPGPQQGEPVLPLIDEAGQELADVSLLRLSKLLQMQAASLLRREKKLELSLHPQLSLPMQQLYVAYLWMKTY